MERSLKLNLLTEVVKYYKNNFKNINFIEYKNKYTTEYLEDIFYNEIDINIILQDNKFILLHNSIVLLSIENLESIDLVFNKNNITITYTDFIIDINFN